jgi:hypothetical protein
MKTVRLAWFHFILHVPARWEVVGYKRDPNKGQLFLSDRRGPTLMIHWRRQGHRTKGVSVDRRLLTQAKGNYEQQGMEEPGEAKLRKRVRSVGEWTAFLPTEPVLPALAGLYVPETRILLNLIFPPHPDNSEARIRRILNSYEPNIGPERAWAAFGMDFTVPESMDLIQVQAMPAAQTFLFENRREESLSFHRYGLLDRLLAQDDMASFFARIKGQQTLLYRGEEFEKDGCPGLTLHYTTRGSGGIGSLMARKWDGRVLAWYSKERQRLYYIDNNARPKNMLGDLAERMRTT